MKSARERMDIISAYREVGSYRGAAAISGTTPKTVRRVIARHESGGWDVVTTTIGAAAQGAVAEGKNILNFRDEAAARARRRNANSSISSKGWI